MIARSFPIMIKLISLTLLALLIITSFGVVNATSSGASAAAVVGASAAVIASNNMQHEAVRLNNMGGITGPFIVSQAPSLPTYEYYVAGTYCVIDTSYFLHYKLVLCNSAGDIRHYEPPLSEIYLYGLVPLGTVYTRYPGLIDNWVRKAV